MQARVSPAGGAGRRGPGVSPAGPAGLPEAEAAAGDGLTDRTAGDLFRTVWACAPPAPAPRPQRPPARSGSR